MDLKTRKRWSLLILVVGLPLYIVVAVSLVNWMGRHWGRPSILIELMIYVLLGLVWIWPCKRIFTGIGKDE